MAQAGFPVPNAVVLTDGFLTWYSGQCAPARTNGQQNLATSGRTHAARSSASNEDGAEQLCRRV